MDPNQKLHDSDDMKLIDASRYKRLIGCLIYLSLTRPDIAFVMSVVSQFIHAPTLVHMKVVYRILKYLKDDLGKGLGLAKTNSLCMEAYTDAD